MCDSSMAGGGETRPPDGGGINEEEAPWWPPTPACPMDIDCGAVRSGAPRHCADDDGGGTLPCCRACRPDCDVPCCGAVRASGRSATSGTLGLGPCLKCLASSTAWVRIASVPVPPDEKMVRRVEAGIQRPQAQSAPPPVRCREPCQSSSSRDRCSESEHRSASSTAFFTRTARRCFSAAVLFFPARGAGADGGTSGAGPGWLPDEVLGEGAILLRHSVA